MVAIMMRCPGCNRLMEWSRASILKDPTYGWITVDLENPNCRLYESEGTINARK
jgi:hypothetical protein